MAERVAGHPLRDPGLPHRRNQRSLKQGFVDVMPPLFAGFRVTTTAFLYKHELPTPLPVRAGILAREGVWQLNAPTAVRQVLPVDLLDALKMLLQTWNHPPGHYRYPVFVPLPFADSDLAALEVQVLDSQT
jgi:hypothetical protein